VRRRSGAAHTEQAGRGRDIDAAETVLRQPGISQDLEGEPGLHAIDAGVAGKRQPAARPYPDSAVGRRNQRLDIETGEAVGVAHLVEEVAIVTVDASLGARPDVMPRILAEGVDGDVFEALLLGVLPESVALGVGGMGEKECGGRNVPDRSEERGLEACHDTHIGGEGPTR